MAGGAGREGLTPVGPRGRLLVIVALLAGALLFAGQWLAGFLADRWWGGAIGPEAVAFLTGVHLLRLTLTAAAVMLAVVWYGGHLLLVHRAIGSVQISRQVANLEFREAVTPSVLLPAAIGLGVVLGVLAGIGAGDDWPAFALAWQGVRFGATEPQLGRDVGFYVAQLPLWQAVHRFARLLTWSGLVMVVALYGVLGAVRWNRGRVAISDHARRHVGYLLAAVALLLAWGALLTPPALVASGAHGSVDWMRFEGISYLVAGSALGAAVFSVAWSLRPLHLPMLVAWAVLLAGLAAFHAWGPPAGATVEDRVEARAAADRIAFGLWAIHTPDPRVAGGPAEGAPALWNADAIDRMITADSHRTSAADRVVLEAGGERIPAWLVLRESPAGALTLHAIADAWTSPGGGPVSYRAGDSLGYPGLVSYADAGEIRARPGAPRVLVGAEAPGPEVGSLPRRLALAWALQSSDLLRADPSIRVAWILSPRERLAHLAPFADWEAVRPILLDHGLGWAAYGYLTTARFPGSSRVSLPGRSNDPAAYLEAAFIGIVDATTGASTVYLTGGASRWAEAWRVITAGLVRPADELPPLVLGQLPYPPLLFDAQARLFEAPPWNAGRLTGRGSGGQGDPSPPSPVWGGGRSVGEAAVYEGGSPPGIRAILTARADPEGWELSLQHLVGFDSVGVLPAPGALRTAWERFPSFEQVSDSVGKSGARMERGPWRILPREGDDLAYQPWYGIGPNGRVTVAYVAVALRDKLGGGRSFPEAWTNLRGQGAPLPPGSGPPTPLDEARRWMLQLEAALRAGDWEAFGRAFGALRRTLGTGAGAP